MGLGRGTSQGREERESRDGLISGKWVKWEGGGLGEQKKEKKKL
jgi:hypothetical protein